MIAHAKATRMLFLAAAGIALMAAGCESSKSPAPPKPAPAPAAAESAGDAPAPAGKPAHLEALVTPEQYQQKLAETKVPVVVDFTAVWCGPCQALAPVLAELQSEWSGRAEFYAVDIDKSPQIAKQMNITGIPVLAFYSGGKEVRRLVGLHTKAQVSAVLQEIAAK